MQGIQWTNSPLAQICIQEFAIIFLSRFSCWAIAINLLTYVYTALWLNATTRNVFIVQSSRSNASHTSSCLLCQTWYVSNTKTLVHVLERISNVMNI
jgi:hypothetical protein